MVILYPTKPYHAIYWAEATVMPLTKKQIFAAADRLAEGGAIPTLEALRAEVGGSYFDFSPALREWKVVRRDAPPPS